MAASFLNVQEKFYKTGIVKESDIKALQVWVESQPHLPKVSELDLILFLHSCHCSNESAKQCIDTFYSIRTHCPEFFKDQDPRKNPNLYRSHFCTLLPKRTKDGYQILMGYFMDHRASVFHFDQLVKEIDMATVFGLHKYGPAEGFILLHDMTGLTLGHLTKINLLHMKKFLTYLQDALPVRFKGLHYINVVSFIDKLMAVVKPFLKEELREFIYFHEDLDDMKKYIDLECLPADFGGSEPCLDEMRKTAMEDMIANAKFFDDLENQVVDESLRPEKPKNAGDFFGTEGTFKKLDID